VEVVDLRPNSFAGVDQRCSSVGLGHYYEHFETGKELGSDRRGLAGTGCADL
jgi:hypothetical protein